MKRALAVAALVGTVSLAGGPARAEPVWHVMCIDTDAYTLPVKAIGSLGIAYDIRAIPTGDPELLDVRAIRPNETPLPVEVLAAPDDRPFANVKAIESKSDILPVKAVTARGVTLAVEAFHVAEGDTWDIRCINRDGGHMPIKAISPEGRVFDLEGFTHMSGQEELGVEILAHIKAVPQK